MSRLPGWLRWGALAVFLFLLPLPVVSALEERDTFCIACHTVPEVAYFNRAQAALTEAEPPADLSSAHYLARPGFRCIDCHRGSGSVPHRAATLALGARDALIFVAGRADPALEKTAIVAPGLLAAGCLNCHTGSLLVAGFANHFHNKLPAAYAAWQAGGRLAAPPGQPAAAVLAPSATALRCLDCHRTHTHTPGGELFGYLDMDNVVLPACVQCHLDAGAGPLELIGNQ